MGSLLRSTIPATLDLGVPATHPSALGPRQLLCAVVDGGHERDRLVVDWPIIACNGFFKEVEDGIVGQRARELLFFVIWVGLRVAGTELGELLHQTAEGYIPGYIPTASQKSAFRGGAFSFSFLVKETS